MNPFLIQSQFLQRYMAFWQGVFDMQRQIMSGMVNAATAAAQRATDSGEAAMNTAHNQISEAADTVTAAASDRMEDGIEAAQDMMAPTPATAARSRMPRAGGL